MSRNYRIKVALGPVCEIFVETLAEVNEEISELKREYPLGELTVYTRSGHKVSDPWYLM